MSKNIYVQLLWSLSGEVQSKPSNLKPTTQQLDERIAKVKPLERKARLLANEAERVATLQQRLPIQTAVIPFTKTALGARAVAPGAKVRQYGGPKSDLTAAHVTCSREKG